MKIYGLDFTSAPSLKKPIVYAQCRFDEDCLLLEHLGCLTSFAEFETFFSQSGPWVAGMDFPFGQPRTLVENIGWPQTWQGYVDLLANSNEQGDHGSHWKWMSAKRVGWPCTYSIPAIQARQSSPPYCSVPGLYTV